MIGGIKFRKKIVGVTDGGFITQTERFIMCDKS